MRIVSDTNTFLAVALNEPERSLLVRLTTGHELVAPEVLPFEIGNALVAMTRKGVLQLDEVGQVWNAVQTIAVDLQPIDIHSALRMAVRFNIYAYDAYFLECALNLRAPLLTLDRKMKQVARELSIQILE